MTILKLVLALLIFTVLGGAMKLYHDFPDTVAHVVAISLAFLFCYGIAWAIVEDSRLR